MTHLTLAAIRSMLPHGATSHHLAHAAWLATDQVVAFIGGFESSEDLDFWAGAHPAMGTLTVTYTYPDECPKIGQYETL